jgi:L-threonylcarbamoyladenylate synthase
LGTLDKKSRLLVVKEAGEREGGLKEGGTLLRSGNLVAFPTESFYGLAVDARNEGAISRLLKAKGRSPHNPILILISDMKEVDRVVTRIPHQARRLMEAFWPGGLTLIFEARKEISPQLTASTGKIGVRLSSHPIATGLARALGRPITGTSANLAGQPACVSAQEVLSTMSNAVDLILDGGKTPGGRGSTVLDITVEPPRVLRRGMVEEESIARYL